MKQAIVFLLAACLLGACSNVHATEVQEPSQSTLPLYDAFKSFCVETGAKPAVVNATVEAAGGKLDKPSVDSTRGVDSMGTPFPLTLTIWDITLNGHRMSVSSGTSYPSRKFGNGPDFDSCDIQSPANEDGSVEAIRRWASVEPNRVSTNSPTDKWAPNLTIYYYTFELSGPVHSVIADENQMVKAEMEGRVWSLVLMQDSHSAAFQLVHELPRTMP